MKNPRHLILLLLFVCFSVQHMSASTPGGDPYLSSSTMSMLSSETPTTAPSAVSGAYRPCPQSIQQYTTTHYDYRAVSWEWEVPSGWTIISGLGTQSITVRVGNSGGFIKVWGVGRDNTDGPVRSTYKSIATMSINMHSDSYIDSYTYGSSGETHYEVARDESPRETAVDVNANISASSHSTGKWHLTHTGSWASPDPTYYTSSQSNIKIPYSQNTSTYDKVETIRVGCTTVLDEIHLIQKPPYIEKTPVSGTYESGSGTTSTPYLLDKDGGTFKIKIHTNSNWYIAHKPNWMTSSINDGEHSTLSNHWQQISFSYAAAPVNGDVNKDYIVFSAGGKTIRVDVEQHQRLLNPEPDPNDYIEKLSETADEIKVRVTKNASSLGVDMDLVNVAGTVSIDGNWINGNTTFTDSETPFSYSISSNPTAMTTRTGRINFHSGGETKSIVVQQDKATPVLSTNPDSYLDNNTGPTPGEYYLDKDGGSFQIQVNSNYYWQVDELASWLSCSGCDGQKAGNQTLTFTYGPFASDGDYKKGPLKITLNGSSADEEFEFIQRNKQINRNVNPSDYLSTNTISVGYEVTAPEYVLSDRGGEVTINITGESDVNWDLEVESSTHWLEPVGAVQGTGPGSVTYSYNRIGGASRAARIRVKAEGLETVESVYLRQKTITAASTSSPLNWVMTTVYGEEGRVAGQNIAYYDKLGKPTQNISRNIEKGNVIASETVYDDYGRPWVSTMAIPVEQTSLTYVDNFINMNTLLSSNEIWSESKAGQYYYSGNSAEPYVPESDYAFSRVEYSQTIPGAVRASYGAGEAYEDDHPVSSWVVAASPDEMLKHTLQDYLNLFTLCPHGETPEVTGQYEGMTKSVSYDTEGKESVTYYDAQGQTVASCMSSDSPDQSFLVTNTIKTPNEVGYVDIHLPQKSSNYTITKGGDTWYHEVVDLKTDALVANGSATTVSLPPGVYRFACTDDILHEDNPSISYTTGYKYYSFNAYDHAGRPVRSMSPKMVKEFSTLVGDYSSAEEAAYLLSNRTKYDIRGQVVESYSPDEGLTTYKYTRDGKIRFSQNAQQRADNKFSFTNYDNQGRPVVSGVTFSTTYTAACEDNALVEREYEAGQFNLHTPTSTSAADYEDMNFTYYDFDFNSEINSITGLSQKYLRGKVAKTKNENNTTWYGYSYDGLMDWVVQRTEGFDGDNDGTQDYSVIKYEYDYDKNVISVEQYLIDNGGNPRNNFTHHYEYDYNSNLTAVYTQAGTAPKELQARYEYYTHGPLKRVEIAENLQGIDYVYTLNGMLKSINHPYLDSKDPGKDGYAGAHQAFAKDIFAMALDYHQNDYTRSGSNITFRGGQSRYDGNIVSQRSQNAFWSSNSSIMQAFRYEYDERNYLAMAQGGMYNGSTGSFTAFQDQLISGPEQTVGTYLPIQYDYNGNIKELHRSGLDELTYNYFDGTNQLSHVDDGIVSPVSLEDKGDQAANNYAYDNIGRMTANAQDGHYFEYDVTGKVTAIYNDAAHSNQKVTYKYDDRGFRIAKINHETGIETWYVRDLSGNILARYKKDGNTELEEVPLYGANRLGMARYTTNNTLSGYMYELSDHLGNVRAVFERETETPSQAEILIAQNYYPFGMILDHGTANGETYNFGYQGQFAEEDEETGYNQFEARLYDSRLGRWMTIDPAYEFWSPYLGQANNPINGYDPNGEDWEPCTGEDGKTYLQDNETFEIATRWIVNTRGLSDQFSPQEWKDIFLEATIPYPEEIDQGFDWSVAVANAEDAIVVWSMEDLYLPFGDIAAWSRYGLTKAGARIFGRNTVSATARVLNAAPAKLSHNAIKHIMKRHWYGSTAKGAGKFSKDMSVQKLNRLIETATTKGSFRPNTLNRSGTIAEYNFGRVIGTNIQGNPVSNLRVVISTSGEVITAFPF